MPFYYEDKVTKEEANYRKAPPRSSFVCVNCTHFNEIIPGEGTCDVVKGIVSKGHTSDLFAPNPDKVGDYYN